MLANGSSRWASKPAETMTKSGLNASAAGKSTSKKIAWYSSSPSPASIGTLIVNPSPAPMPRSVTHQYPHYPGTGRATERGIGAGEGFTINVPMDAGDGDDEYHAIFLAVLLPAAEAFKPDFVIVSAGFDAHRDDPLANMGLTEAGYSDLTGLVVGLAKRHAQGRLLSALEGGYNLTALGASVDAHLKALLAA